MATTRKTTDNGTKAKAARSAAGTGTRSQRPTLRVGTRSGAAAKRDGGEAPAAARPRASRDASAKKKPTKSGTVAVKKKVSDDRESNVRKLALSIAEAGLDKKASNVEIIDVRGKVDYADYVIVMSGRSDRQVAALARHIEDQLLRRDKQRCISVEGLPQGAWVLMDYGDVVVHIFHEDTRGYYDLESLWMDAARVEVADQAESPR